MLLFVFCPEEGGHRLHQTLITVLQTARCHIIEDLNDGTEESQLDATITVY